MPYCQGVDFDSKPSLDAISQVTSSRTTHLLKITVDDVHISDTIMISFPPSSRIHIKIIVRDITGKEAAAAAAAAAGQCRMRELIMLRTSFLVITFLSTYHACGPGAYLVLMQP